MIISQRVRKGAASTCSQPLRRAGCGFLGPGIQIISLVNYVAVSDTGLADGTTYYYRVTAYNLNGSSGSTTASATTPQAPALSLSASGYEVKGVHQLTLD